MHPSCLQARSRVHPGQVISSSLGQHAETNNISRLSFTPKREPEYLERSYIDVENMQTPYKRVPGTLRGFNMGTCRFLIYSFWL